MNAGNEHEQTKDYSFESEPIDRSLTEQASLIGQATLDSVKQCSELLALESKLALLSLTQMLVATILVSVGLLSVWILLMSMCVVVLQQIGVPVIAILGGLLLINVIAVLLGWKIIKSLSQNLGFDSSRRKLFAILDTDHEEKS